MAQNLASLNKGDHYCNSVAYDMKHKVVKICQLYIQHTMIFYTFNHWSDIKTRKSKVKLIINTEYKALDAK